MDLVKIDGFSYSVRVQHLTPSAVQARARAEELVQQEMEKAAAEVAEDSNGGSAAEKPKDQPAEESSVQEAVDHVLMNQRTPLYDMQLILPNDEHVGLNILVRQSILRRYPALGMTLGPDFDREKIELLIQSVTLLGPCYGNARQLAELAGEVRA